MSEFLNTGEYQIFRYSFRKFLKEEVLPYYDEWENQRLIPKSVWKLAGAQGFLCPWLEEKYGGPGAGLEFSVIIAEELAHAGVAGLMLPLHSDIVVPYLYSLGTEEQRKKWLPRCAGGELISAIAMTEPHTGSDLAAIKTTAKRVGGEYVLNGSKTFISNGINADLVIVACKTHPVQEKQHSGISLLVVEGGTPGFSRGKKLEKLGLHCQDTAELFFEDCRVPLDNLLGEEGQGFRYMMQKLQQERLFAALLAQGMAEGMLKATINYCQTRKVFGKPVSAFQANTFKLVEMATEVEMGRVFVDSLVKEHLAGRNIVKKVSMAKYWITDKANQIAYDCLQMFGGYGFMAEYPISRWYRDIRVFPIFAGTNEVMKTIIAKELGL